ncbi:MAG: diaminopimelate dehydrogenase [Bacteroidales bacterium]|nr:diaminopimelate dehydrogenase [Bacteroidales bacterium]
MKTIKAAIVGYGNIGRHALEALEAAPDMECVGIVRRNPSKEGFPELEPYKVVSDIAELGEVDVAILATPSRAAGENARKYLSLGINTVDSFDIHTGICELRAALSPVAEANDAVSIISAGWDPGTDSIVRALIDGMLPEGTTYTNFGPGRSMGHSVAAASKPGVVKALSMTIPVGKGIHRREVFVELEPGADFAAVEQAIKTDPYFIHDDTTVKAVPSVDAIDTHNHGVCLEREGISGKTPGQKVDFNMRINNPALTAQVLVMAARATLRQSPGCYTMIEIPVIDYLAGDRESLIRRLV